MGPSSKNSEYHGFLNLQNACFSGKQRSRKSLCGLGDDKLTQGCIPYKSDKGDESAATLSQSNQHDLTVCCSVLIAIDTRIESRRRTLDHRSTSLGVLQRDAWIYLVPPVCGTQMNQAKFAQNAGQIRHLPGLMVCMQQSQVKKLIYGRIKAVLCLIF